MTLSGKLLRLPTAVAMLVVAMTLTSFQKKESGTVKLKFINYVGDKILNLDSTTYINESGQVYTISKFRYYIGNIRLRKADNKEIIFKDYYLVNEDEISSKEITLENIPEGNYTSLEFILGVDSIHNCSGIQSGALDPANGMFWTWNSGYVFLKLEGHSPRSLSPGNIFEYHIGGFTSTNNCIKAFDLKLHSLSVNANTNAMIFIKADVSEIFKTPVTIDFSKISSVTDFHNATMIAENYSDLFSVMNEKP